MYFSQVTSLAILAVVIPNVIADKTVTDWKTTTCWKTSTDWKTTTDRTTSTKSTTTTDWTTSTKSTTITNPTTKTVTQTSSCTPSTSITTVTQTVTASPSTFTQTVTQTVTTTSNSPYESFTVNYNFEDLNNGDITPLAVTAVGIDSLLNFENFAVVDNTLSSADLSVIGVPPATPPNFIAFNSLISTEQSVDATAPGIISIDYTESIISFFNPSQFYYGCVVASQENELSLPISCNITAAGIDVNGNLVATQAFTYTVPLLTTSMPMELGYFISDFSNLAQLEFAVTADSTTAGLIDNFVATLYEVPSAAFFPTTPATS